MSGPRRKHGRSVEGKIPPIYAAWRGMRQRCGNPNNPGFRYYGGRGIAVCARWADFLVFAEDMGEPPPGTSLDRIDPDGPYAPENCRWATRSVQQSNRRPYKTPKAQGAGHFRSGLTDEQVREIRAPVTGTKMLTHREIAAAYGVSRSTISRLLRGESYSETLA